MQINTYIDHTLLKPEATEADIKKLCAEALKYNFKTVCINAFYIPYAANILKNSTVGICTVVGFPLGATSTEVKAFETKKAIDDGATEIDMVLNIGALKSGLFDYVQNDIKTLADICHSNKKILKVIFETCLLTDDEIKKACELSGKAGADFVKTSTGFSKEGATPHAVTIMKNSVSEKMQIKASGGVRDLAAAKMYIELGATRLGTSSGVAIMENQVSQTSY